MDLSMTVVALAVVATVGSIQWLKGFFKPGPTWPWRILMALLCFGWGIAIGPTWVTRALYSLFFVAVAEACYTVIVKGLPDLASSLIDKLKR